jgi:hypothetical protein
LRIIKPEFPDAHRVRGNDGGIDVLSDYKKPPERGWQAKNYDHVPWRECRTSLKAAMASDKPLHYTFVFPFVLTKNQRDFWRDDFLPEQRKIYADLGTLDYIDDLAQRIEQRPDLIDLLSDGTFGVYFRETMAQAGAEGVNPLASAADLVSDPMAMAEHAIQIGKRDPDFRYSLIGREAGAGDAEIAESGRRFTMNHGIENLPNFSMTIRDGDHVAELQAEPREGALREAPVPWFAPGADGDAVRHAVRVSLAKGEPIEVRDEAVGVTPGAVPDRFRAQLTDDGLLRNGIVTIGLSESVEMTIELTLGEKVASEAILLYRIPTLGSAMLSYGGNYNGAVFTVDLEELADMQVDSDQLALEMHLGLMFAFNGERAKDAISGLGFADAFGKADRVRLECPGLLPDEGIEFEGDQGENHNREAWEVAAVIAVALSALEAHDGRLRAMPDSVSPSDRYAAQMTFQVLTEGGIEIPVDKEFELPLLGEDVDGKRPAELVDSEVELPPIAGEPTGLIARRTLVDVEPVEIVSRDGQPPRLRICPAEDCGKIVIALPENTDNSA